MEPIRTLIVDDEALSRQRLRTLLADLHQVEIVGEADNGLDALAMIRDLRPALVFLDVQMPELDGFEVVAHLDQADAPAIVFATGYDEFALRAFEANAVDYLVKPIGANRLAAAVARVAERLQTVSGSVSLEPRITAMLRALASRSVYKERFAVRNGNRHVIVRATEIVWMEAADNYVRLHTGTGAHLLRSRMSDLEDSLDPQQFLRIHRSIILNVDQVLAIEPWGLNEYLFVLRDNTKVTSSRRYRKAIRAVFGV